MYRLLPLITCVLPYLSNYLPLYLTYLSNCLPYSSLACLRNSFSFAFSLPFSCFLPALFVYLCMSTFNLLLYLAWSTCVFVCLPALVFCLSLDPPECFVSLPASCLMLLLFMFVKDISYIFIIYVFVCFYVCVCVCLSIRVLWYVCMCVYVCICVYL